MKVGLAISSMCKHGKFLYIFYLKFFHNHIVKIINLKHECLKPLINVKHLYTKSFENIFSTTINF